MDIADLRRDYCERGLRREELAADPIDQFTSWFQQACDADVLEPNAMALATVDAEGSPSQRTVLLKYFDPAEYIIKLTPMHKTAAATQQGYKTKGNYTEYYPYAEHEKRLADAGYDVLVFIASKEEDEGLITCGNAILSGTRPSVEYTEREW